MRRAPAAAAVCVAIALAPLAASAPHPLHGVPVIPDALLERGVPLRAGVGTVHDRLTTSSEEAQRFYDQGLAYLHSYVWIEAARSFHQALRLDSTLALAHVGLSVAYTEVNRPDAARGALARAQALGPGVSVHERQHILVRERQMEAEASPADAARLTAYRRALDEATAAFPGDAELWLLRGIAEAADASDRGQGSPAAAAPYFARALEARPDHFAAHHYLAHAYENSGRISDALPHAAAYARLAPGVPHARHMHGHELRRAGEVAAAIAEFEAADRLHAAYFAAEGVAPEFDWHYEHNLGLLAMSHLHAGRVAQAGPLLERAFALPTLHLVQAFNKRGWPLFLRLRGRAGEALQAADALASHANPIVQAVGQIEAAHARLAGRQFAEAAAATNAALRLLKSAGAGAGLAALPFAAVQGEFFLRTGEGAKGRAMLEEMITRARARPGPDEWAQTLFALEWIARAAREAGDWELAGRVAGQMLAHDPAYAGGHYAQALAAEQAGDRRAAAAALAHAIERWRGADPDLPELADARARLARIGSR